MVYISRLCEPISEFCFGRNVVQCITEMGYSYTGVHLDLFWTIYLPKNTKKSLIRTCTANTNNPRT